MEVKLSKHSGPNVVKQLRRGKKRRLTRSEIDRGYFFVTMAKWREEFLDANDFTIIFNGNQFSNRRLDKYGRTNIGRSFLSKFEPETIIEVRLLSRKKISVTTT